MSALRCWLLVFACCFSVLSHADEDSPYTIVGLQCDTVSDSLLITYQGGLGHWGERLVREMGDNHWDLWAMYYAGKPVAQQCRLSDGHYDIVFSTYHSGSCDYCIGIWAKVTRNGKSVFDYGLDGHEGPPTQTVITAARIKAHSAKPEIATLTWEEFLEQAQYQQ